MVLPTDHRSSGTDLVVISLGDNRIGLGECRVETSLGAISQGECRIGLGECRAERTKMQSRKHSDCIAKVITVGTIAATR